MMGYVTQIGTGIIRMIGLLHTGKEPEFEERDEEFVVKLWIAELLHSHKSPLPAYPAPPARL